MEGERLRGVEFIAANTDAQDLNHSLAHKKVYMGKALTKGLGAGMDPDIGKQAAEENRSEIGELLDGADVIFITAGMGGGTGTGASPVIADIAREKGILTIAFITKPFSFEGTQRMNIAQEGLMRLKDKVDAFVAIPNDRIFALIDKDTSVAKAFSYVDDVLKKRCPGYRGTHKCPRHHKRRLCRHKSHHERHWYHPYRDWYCLWRRKRYASCRRSHKLTTFRELQLKAQGESI